MRKESSQFSFASFIDTIIVLCFVIIPIAEILELSYRLQEVEVREQVNVHTVWKKFVELLLAQNSVYPLNIFLLKYINLLNTLKCGAVDKKICVPLYVMFNVTLLIDLNLLEGTSIIYTVTIDRSRNVIKEHRVQNDF